jgi:hypothetical protein
MSVDVPAIARLRVGSGTRLFWVERESARKLGDKTMNMQDLVGVAELIASIGVVISLVYLAIQVRHGARVSLAEARHEISAFALEMSMFNAEHADRLARVHGSGELTEGDRLFRWWNHMMVFLHAETYFRHRELGLMPASHWDGYRRFVWGYLDTPGVTEFWGDVGPAFSREFAGWVDGLLAEKAATTR